MKISWITVPIMTQMHMKMMMQVKEKHCNKTVRNRRKCVKQRQGALPRNYNVASFRNITPP